MPAESRNGAIIWLASYPKSGNTWVRIFLAQWLTKGRANINNLDMLGLSGGDGRADFYEFIAGKPLAEITPEELPVIRRLVHFNIAERSGITFTKTHNAFGTIHGIPIITPEVTVGAVYICRDPRDVAVSYANHYGCTLDQAVEFLTSDLTEIHAPDSATSHLLSWRTHVRSWLSVERRGLHRKVNGGEVLYGLHTMKYEDMKADPVGSFRALIKWLRWEPDGRRMAKAIEASSFSAVRKQEQEHGFRETGRGDMFFRAGRTGDWQNALSEPQVRRLEEHAGDTMLELGYKLAY